MLEQPSPRYDERSASLALLAGLQSLAEQLDTWVPPPVENLQPLTEDPPLLALLGLLALRAQIRPLMDAPPAAQTLPPPLENPPQLRTILR